MPKVPAEPADLRTQHGRLRWAREAKGYASPRAAAKALEWNENTYKSHEQGIRQAEGLKTKHLERYARAFGVSLEWLAFGRGSPVPKAEQNPLEIAQQLLAAMERNSKVNAR